MKFSKKKGMILLVFLLFLLVPGIIVSEKEDKKEKIILKTGTIDVSEGSASLSEGTFIIKLDYIPSEEEKKRLEKEEGIKLVSYVSTNTWIAKIKKQPKITTGTSSKIRYTTEFKPTDKVSPYLKEKKIGKWARNADDTVTIVLSFLEEMDDATIDRIVDDYGGVLVKKEKITNSIYIAVDENKIEDISLEDGVKWIAQAPPPMSVVNDGTRATTGVNVLQGTNYNLTGEGIVVMVYDGGSVDADHLDLNNRVTVGDAISEDSHATHVAGTLAGNGSQCQKGMAPKASIISYYWSGSPYALYNSTGDIQSDYNAAMDTYGALISTNSIGSNAGQNNYPCGWNGDYEQTAQLVDNIVRGSLGEPFIVLYAAGNERGYGCANNWSAYPGYNTTGIAGTAKNPIVVGATDDSDAMTTYSSWGPTDDGRIRPDIVSPGGTSGDPINSAEVGGGCTTKYGTSMATPAVSGIVALMLEQYNKTNGNFNILPSTVKAVLMHTAKDLNNTGPDYTTGWGRVNATEVVDYVKNDATKNQIIEGNITASGENRTYYFIVPAGLSELKVTLVWDDAAAEPLATTTLVNDLDLVVKNSTGDIFYPWTLDKDDPSADAVQTQKDSINNVEQVYVSSPAAGIWSVIVNGTTVPTPHQTYSIVTNNNGDMAPAWKNNATNNTVPKKNEVVQFNITWNDSIALSSYLFSWNDTGTWVNISNGTMSGKEWNISLNMSVSATRGNVVSWKFHANDSEDNWNVTDEWSFTVQNTVPIVGNLSLNSTDNLNRTNGSLTLYFDYGDIDNDANTVNETRWYNNSNYVPVLDNISTIGSGNFTANNIWIVSVRAYDGYNYSVWYNSSSITVISIAPDGPTLNAPSDGAVFRVNYTLLNWTAIDNEGDDMDCYVYGDTNSNPISLINITKNIANGTVSVYNWTDISEATNYWKVQCDDGFENSSNSSIYNFTIAIPPTTYPSLVSASDSDKDGNIELTWSDDGNESGESYRVYRFTSNITSINSPVKNVTSGINEGTQSYEDSTSVHGQTYWYALVTVDAAGNYNDSIFSNTLNGTANDTISPNSVTNMNVTASGATATFRWYNATQDTSSNADTQNMRYVIYYGTNFNRSKSLANESITGYTTKTVSGNSTTISVSSTGKYHFVVTSLDDGGNKNLALSYSNNYGNASLTYSSDDGNGGSSGGGGGGGGGGGVATSSATMEFVNIGYIASGDTAKAEFTKEIGITQIEFKVKQTATASSITVADMGSNSGIALKLFEDDDKRAVHKYLKITLGKVSSTNIEEAVIRFNVPKDESFKPSTVRLRRYDSWNKHWATLPTTHYKEDVLNHYFRASTPGFSIFAITGETGYVEEDEEEEVEITAEVEDEEEEEVFEEVAVVEKKNTKILDWIMGIVAASFVFLIIAHVVLKKGKKLFE